MDYRTLCILGGTGFVGRHLTARLVDAGYHVKILTRDPSRHRDLLVLPTVKLVRADVHDPATLKREFEAVGAVINLVGILNERGHNGAGFEHVHVELTRKVLDACRETHVPRLLQMSALGANPASASHYQRTRGEAAQLLPLTADGVPATTVFEPSVIFGPQDTFINRFVRLLKLSPGILFLPCPDARLAPVYVGDVAEAFVRSLTRRDTVGERFALYGPDTYTMREIVKYTARMIGVHRAVIGLPDWASRLMANILEYAPGKPFSRDNYLSFKAGGVDAESGLAALGIEPASLEAEIPNYLAADNQRGRYNHYRAVAGRFKESPPEQ
ncbi:MAG TPA: complex I NDUFA9 subunit family protein [Gammaproteobacteria bacterium]|nr:complex I NDUFA9 subunit family protein [Gammaproteobacteria bacterium]